MYSLYQSFNFVSTIFPDRCEVKFFYDAYLILLDKEIVTEVTWIQDPVQII